MPRSVGSVSSVVASMAMLSAIVFVHECGHYLPARLLNIEVVEFSVGMGPKLLSTRAFGNEFVFRAIPLGGFVLFAGSEEDVVEEDESQSLLKDKTMNSDKWLENQPWQKRAVVLSGGVVFNVLLSYVLFLSALVKTGFLEVVSPWKLMRLTCDIIWNMSCGMVYGIGQIFSTLSHNILCQMGQCNPYCFAEPPHAAAQALNTLADPMEGIAGPIQVIKVVMSQSSVAMPLSKAAVTPILLFASQLSLNLGILNALPLPLLDGGHLLFILIEVVTRRKVDKRAQEW
eukprot:CAMPEP_0168774018 /NCGR_PEP_ID=MMETSP0725-20121227/4778_1 /TAXON_ID=265536 /ORGANISM="Amphiprora sp., Strain CCMP467" /LENGTH=285 /DNA_ID=CAMNT_0008823599 /DNA_START=142 /DNA_END=995 /DNA_ORIENTATION=-